MVLFQLRVNQKKIPPLWRDSYVVIGYFYFDFNKSNPGLFPKKK